MPDRPKTKVEMYEDAAERYSRTAGNWVGVAESKYADVISEANGGVDLVDQAEFYREMAEHCTERAAELRPSPPHVSRYHMARCADCPKLVIVASAAKDRDERVAEHRRRTGHQHMTLTEEVFSGDVPDVVPVVEFDTDHKGNRS